METLKFIAKNFGISFLIAITIAISSALFLEKTQMPLTTVFLTAPLIIAISIPMGMSIPIIYLLAVIYGRAEVVAEDLIILALTLIAYAFIFFAIRFKKFWYAQALFITAYLILMYYGAKFLMNVT